MDWLIFILYAALSLVTYHPIIVFILSRSFILYLFTNDLFIILKVVIMFDAQKKSSMYIFTILVLSFDYWIRMLGFPLSWLKPIFL